MVPKSQVPPGPGTRVEPRKSVPQHSERKMKTLLQSVYLKAYDRVYNNEEGQDLVEYALTIVLVALACVAGINGVASAINNVFSNISTSLQ